MGMYFQQPFFEVGIIIMKRKFFALLLVCLNLVACFSDYAYADSESSAKVAKMISGGQDCVIMANISEKGESAYTVEVIEQIGIVNGNDSGDNSKTSIEGSVIEVENLNSYMFYGDYEYTPCKGDNVLLSLSFNGNSYAVENGAYRVDYASHNMFNFIVPDSVDGTVDAIELTALYLYVRSNGQNSDYIVRGGVVYTHSDNGIERVIKEQRGIKFIDKKGETTKNSPGGEADLVDEPINSSNGNKWIYTLVIIAVGALLGCVFVRVYTKLERSRN